MHLADLTSYLDADRRLLELYADRDGWARKAILNIAGSGQVFERPHHRRVRRRDLEREALPGAVERRRAMRARLTPAGCAAARGRGRAIIRCLVRPDDIGADAAASGRDADPVRGVRRRVHLTPRSKSEMPKAAADRVHMDAQRGPRQLCC